MERRRSDQTGGRKVAVVDAMAMLCSLRPVRAFEHVQFTAYWRLLRSESVLVLAVRRKPATKPTGSPLFSYLLRGRHRAVGAFSNPDGEKDGGYAAGWGAQEATALSPLGCLHLAAGGWVTATSQTRQSRSSLSYAAYGAFGLGLLGWRW